MSQHPFSRRLFIFFPFQRLLTPPSPPPYPSPTLSSPLHITRVLLGPAQSCSSHTPIKDSGGDLTHCRLQDYAKKITHQPKHCFPEPPGREGGARGRGCVFLSQGRKETRMGWKITEQRIMSKTRGSQQRHRNKGALIKFTRITRAWKRCKIIIENLNTN